MVIYVPIYAVGMGKVEIVCENAYNRIKLPQNAKNQAVMGIPHKILCVSAILLAGILWSVSSQASKWGGIGTFPRAGAVLTPQQAKFEWLGQKVNGRFRLPNQGLRWNRPVFLSKQEQPHGGIDIVRSAQFADLIVAPYQRSLKQIRREANGSYRAHNRRIPQLSTAPKWNKHAFSPEQKQLNDSIDFGRALPRLVLDSISNQDQSQWLTQEVNGKYGTYSRGSLQGYPSTVSVLDRHVLLLNHEKPRGSIYQPWRFWKKGIGDGRQGKTKVLLRKAGEDPAKRAVKKLAECGSEYWHNGGPVDKDFVANAIRDCGDKEAVHKPELSKKKLFDKSVTGYRLASNSSPRRGDAVISNAPTCYREPYDSDNRLAKIQIQSYPISIRRGLLAPDLALINGEGVLDSQGLHQGAVVSKQRLVLVRCLRHRRFSVGHGKVVSLGFGNETIAQSRELSDCLELWKIRDRHEASIRELQDGVGAEVNKVHLVGTTRELG